MGYSPLHSKIWLQVSHLHDIHSRSRHRRSDSGSVRRDRRFGHPVAQLQQQSLREDGGEQCPLKKGVPATWTYEVFVDPLYPKMTVMAKFELKDNTGLQTCMEIPVVIEAQVIGIDETEALKRNGPKWIVNLQYD